MTIRPVDQQITDTKQQVAVLVEEMARLTNLNSVTGMASWIAVSDWLDNEIRGRVDLLIAVDRDETRCQQLRGEISALKTVRALPMAVMSAIKQKAEKAAGLRDRLAEWQNRGRAELQSTVSVADKLTQRTVP